MTKTELEEKAFQLADDERLDLGQRLVASALPPLTDEQKQQVDDAIALYDTDPSAFLSDEQFQEALGRRLAKRA